MRFVLRLRSLLSPIFNFASILRAHGLSQTCKRVYEAYLYPLLNRDHIRLARIKAGQKIEKILGSPRVAHGPFRGLDLEAFLTWGKSDRGSQLLGIYEKEVVSVLTDEAGPSKVFVDVGSAEGYFAAGVLVSGLYSRVICFEADPRTRSALLRTLSINGVLDRAIIHESARTDFVDVVGTSVSFDFQNTVFLIDIEGGEIEILTPDNLKALEKATIVVEMHPVQVPETKILELEALCRLSHRVEEIATGARDLGEFPELNDFEDDERWLICSEGRYRRGRWLVLRPLHNRS